jgi:hypothetical protein
MRVSAWEVSREGRISGLIEFGLAVWTRRIAAHIALAEPVGYQQRLVCLDSAIIRIPSNGARAVGHVRTPSLQLLLVEWHLALVRLAGKAHTQSEVGTADAETPEIQGAQGELQIDALVGAGAEKDNEPATVVAAIDEIRDSVGRDTIDDGRVDVE